MATATADFPRPASKKNKDNNMNKTQTAAVHLTCVYDAARRKAGDARDTAYAAAERSIWANQDDGEEAFVAREAARDLRTAADATYAVANDDALWAYLRSLAAISK